MQKTIIRFPQSTKSTASTASPASRKWPKSLAGAALLASAAGVAHAQSGVTLYGVIDVPIEYINHLAGSAPTINPVTGAVTSKPGGNKFGMETNGGLSGSRWGLRGVEDLGGGLQGLFVLESGFGADTGQSLQGGRLFGRKAYVGLQSDRLGQIALGRQDTTMFTMLGNFSPSKYALLFEPIVALLGTTYGQDNVISYQAVKGPVTVKAHYSFGVGTPAFGLTPLAGQGAGETPGHARDNTAYGAGAMYLDNRFGVTASYDQWNPAATAGSPGTVKKAALAFAYYLPRTKFVAGYRWGQNKDAGGNTLLRDDFWWVGVNHDLTSALSLSLAYYYDNQKILRTNAVQPALNPVNPWQVNLIADYAFSKRTDVYLTVAYVKNSGLNFDSAAISFANGAYLTPGSNSQIGAAMGIRHKF